jgi:hypothetical protein
MLPQAGATVGGDRRKGSFDRSGKQLCADWFADEEVKPSADWLVRRRKQADGDAGKKSVFAIRGQAEGPADLGIVNRQIESLPLAEIHRRGRIVGIHDIESVRDKNTLYQSCGFRVGENES